MPKNKVKNQKPKVTKVKKQKKPKKKDTSTLSVAIQLNKKLNISGPEDDKTLKQKKEDLIADFMGLAKMHQEYSEKLDEIDKKMNVLLNNILSLDSKYSNIDEFIAKKGWESNDILPDSTEKTIESLEEN